MGTPFHTVCACHNYSRIYKIKEHDEHQICRMGILMHTKCSLLAELDHDCQWNTCIYYTRFYVYHKEDCVLPLSEMEPYFFLNGDWYGTNVKLIVVIYPRNTKCRWNLIKIMNIQLWGNKHQQFIFGYCLRLLFNFQVYELMFIRCSKTG